LIERQLIAIEAHRPLAPGHFRLTLRAPQIAARARAGQFLHVLTRGSGACDPLLRRAFSVAAVHGPLLDIVYRVAGRGTALLQERRAGDILDVLGPLGVPFAVRNAPLLLVGGGVGVPPLAMLAQQEREAAQKAPAAAPPAPITALLGARCRADLLCLEDFAAGGVAVQAVTDDGSNGRQGLVTELLQKQLSGRDAALPQPVVYSCGPLPMLRAVAALCAQHAVECQVSLEECMPCGVGVCNGCVVALRQADDDYGRYRRICVEGPVMDAREIAW
jgi:dihydroorotate dehydrogenase electron transfer subunit